MLFGALWVFVLLSNSHLVVHAALNFIGNTCKNFDTYGNVEKPIEDAFELGVRITKEAYDTINQLLENSEQLATGDLEQLHRMATAFLVSPYDEDSEQALEDLRGMGRQQASAEGAVTHERADVYEKLSSITDATMMRISCGVQLVDGATTPPPPLNKFDPRFFVTSIYPPDPKGNRYEIVRK